MSVVFKNLPQSSTFFLKLEFLLYDTVCAASTGRNFFLQSSGSFYRRQLFTGSIGNFVMNSWIHPVSKPSPQPQNSRNNVAFRRIALTSGKLKSAACCIEMPLTLRLLMSYIYIYIYIYIYMEHLFLMFLDHTQRRSTVGRTRLDE